MKFLISLIFLFPFISKAQLERNVSLLLVSHPQAAVLSTGLAYNYELWRKEGGDFWMYGYLRPKVNWDTSVFVNTLNAEVQVFPVSIFGFSFGTSDTRRDPKKLREFECDIYECRGNVKRNYIKASAAIGFAGVKIAYFYQRDFMNFDQNTDRPGVVDMNDSLLINTGHSQVDKQQVFAGYGLTDKVDVGLLYMQNTAKTSPSADVLSKSQSVGKFVAGMYKMDQFKWTAGLGTYESDYMRRQFSALVKVSWLLDPTLSLMD